RFSGAYNQGFMLNTLALEITEAHWRTSVETYLLSFLAGALMRSVSAFFTVITTLTDIIHLFLITLSAVAASASATR
ncbi:hypothetical protein RW694_27635, partial [Klebsiella pneumoniae]|nr:hypothetical protein [Klebsiella pneumoniae]